MNCIRSNSFLFPHIPTNLPSTSDVEDSFPQESELSQLKVWETKIEELLVREQKDTLTQEFGVKHANIIKQAELSKNLSLSDIDVPEPFGISNRNMQHFLQKKVPQVFELRQKLGQLHNVKSNEGEKILREIETHIAEAFASSNAFATLDAEGKLTKWLQAQKGDYLMVRSSGNEDSQVVANAGSHFSATYVEPNEQSVLKALKEVVSSYFGIHAIQNLQNANVNPFQEELKLSVTIQRLIGEPVGGEKDPAKIPRSMVVFTNMPGFTEGKDFQIMQVSVSYGHGEGVVGDKKVACDTAWIVRSNARPERVEIYYDNQKKTHRLAPVKDPKTGTVKLEKIPNPPELIDQPALSEGMLRNLFQWGCIAEMYFNRQPTDLELVAREGTIYPVQARPIIRPKATPLYFDQQKAPSPLKKLNARMLVPGKGSVEVFDRLEELLVTETLEQAQNLYDKNIHKAILVFQPEPSNSHPVVNFSSLGVPCLFTKNREGWREVEKTFAREKTQLIVDIQTAQLILWNKKQDVKQYISQGYAVHPASLAISLNKPLLGGASPKAQEIKELILSLTTTASHEVAKEALSELEKMAQELENETKEFEAKLLKLEHQPQLAKDIVATAYKLNEKIKESFQDFKTIQKDYPNERMQLLFHAKVLETYFTQFSETNGLGQMNVEEMRNTIKRAESLIKYQKKLQKPARYIDLLPLQEEIPFPIIRKNWKHFLLSLESVEDQSETLHKFRELLKTLENLHALPSFLSIMFQNAYQKEKNPVKVIQQLLEQASEQEKKALEQLLNHQQELGDIQTFLDDFGSPQKVEEVWKRLVKNNESLNMLLPNICKQTDSLVFLCALRNMELQLTAMDSAIKTMKMSASIDQFSKVQLFNTMTHDLFTLFTHWYALEGVNELKKTVEKKLREDTSSIKYPPHISDKYTRFLFRKRSVMEGTDSPSTLQPSDIHINALIIGGSSNFSTSFSHFSTLEDFFSLTHQNCLAILGHLYSKEVYSKLMNGGIPHLLELAINKLHQPNKETKITCISIDKNDFSATLNTPLAFHSNLLKVSYKPEKGNILFDDTFFGFGAEIDSTNCGRWIFIKKALEILESVGAIEMTRPVELKETGINWNLRVRSEQELYLLIDVHRYIVDYTTHKKVSYLFELIHKIMIEKTCEQTKAFEEKMLNYACELLYKEDDISPKAGRGLWKYFLKVYVNKAAKIAEMHLLFEANPKVGLYCWETLLKEKVATDEGRHLCARLLQNQDSNIKDLGVQLLQFLAQNQLQIPDNSLDIAQTLFQSTFSEGLHLIDALLQDPIQKAKIENSDMLTHLITTSNEENTKKLYLCLHKHNVLREQIEQKIIDELNSNQEATVISALELCQKIDPNSAISMNLIVEKIETMLNSNDPKIVESAFKIAHAFSIQQPDFIKTKSYPQWIKIVSKHCENPKTQRSAYYILEKLVKMDDHYDDEMFKLVHLGLKSDRPPIGYFSINTLKNWLSKDPQLSKKILDIAVQHTLDDGELDHNNLVKLWNLLIPKDQNVEETETAISTIMKGLRGDRSKTIKKCQLLACHFTGELPHGKIAKGLTDELKKGIFDPNTTFQKNSFNVLSEICCFFNSEDIEDILPHILEKAIQGTNLSVKEASGNLLDAMLRFDIGTAKLKPLIIEWFKNGQESLYGPVLVWLIKYPFGLNVLMQLHEQMNSICDRLIPAHYENVALGACKGLAKLKTAEASFCVWKHLLKIEGNNRDKISQLASDAAYQAILENSDLGWNLCEALILQNRLMDPSNRYIYISPESKIKIKQLQTKRTG